jgi:hypothetical protein
MSAMRHELLLCVCLVGGCGTQTGDGKAADTKGAVKADAKSEAKGEPKPETKRDAEPAAQAETPPEAKADSPTPTPAPGPAKSTLLAIRDGSLVELDLAGKPVGTLVATDATWCRTDERAQGVWLERIDPGGTVQLQFVDLAGTPAPARTVVEGKAAPRYIDYGDEHTGIPPEHLFDLVSVLDMASGSAQVRQGCDGDMSFSCFEDDGKLNAELAAQKKKLEGAKVVDAALLGTLKTRAAGRKLWSVATAADPALPTNVEVPKEPCEEAPEDCGQARPVPGTGYVAVVVAQSRGDFFHEDLQLYDPARKLFFDARHPKATGTAPLQGIAPDANLWIAPDGRAYLALTEDTPEALVSFAEGVVFTTETTPGPVCGWRGGGYSFTFQA